MGRARRARKIAATAAYGGGGVAAASAALGLIGYAVVRAEGAIARRIVGQPFEGAPVHEGGYGAGPGEPVRMLVLGDSLAAGLGADHPTQTIGAIVANGVAALKGRRVELTNVAVVGAESSDLERQLATGLEIVESPDLVLLIIGANDVTHRADRATAVRHLETTVRRARAAGAEVVVGTCPDLGTVEPVPQPLRLLIRRWSRDLAAAQTVAVVEAGGRTVSLGDLLGHEFAAAPRELFGQDRFHPSPAGYARTAAALLPTVCNALGIWGTESPATHGATPVVDADDRAPERRRGEGVGPVAVAAGQAVLEPGTEVSPAEVAGQTRGPRGRWAVLRHRRPVPALPVEPTAEPTPPEGSGAASTGTSDLTDTATAQPSTGLPTGSRESSADR
jgi:lysophospholipase L1-like esterase